MAGLRILGGLTLVKHPSQDLTPWVEQLQQQMAVLELPEARCICDICIRAQRGSSSVAPQGLQDSGS